MRLSAIHRHPVKAMGGEALELVEVDQRGLVGDRGWAVFDADGKIATGKNSTRFRRHDHVFDYSAAISASGVFVTGHGGHWRVGDAALDDELSDRLGAPMSLQPEGEVLLFDSSPISIIGTATLAHYRELGIDADHRRLRANFVVETAEPFEEESWIGRDACIGALRLHVTKRIVRCRMIDLDQNGLETTTPWLKTLAPRDAQLAVYARVLQPAVVRVGDQVALADNLAR